MKNNPSLDIRIVNYIFGKLDKYVVRKSAREEARLEKLWQDKFKNTDYFIHPLDNGLKIKLYKDSVLSKFIYDGFETSEINFLNLFLNEGDYFADIGANIGLFSLYAAKKVGPTGSVISFEPAGVTYKRLLENCNLNELKNLKAYGLGLSDKDEWLELNISTSGHEAWNTFVKSDNNKFSSKETVQVKSFDNFLSENAIDTDKISLIKLDVEGFELNVLKGASKLLSKENAPVWMIEFTDENAISAGNCCHEIYKLLTKYGYTWYTYDADQSRLIYEPMRLNYPYNNLIAVKNAKANKRISKFKIETV